MAYNIKDVFYLSTSCDIAATTAGVGSAQLDLSAYIDPIARGRTKGTGLAVYKAHFSMLGQDGQPLPAGETGVMVASLQAGLGVGDNDTGTAFAFDDTMTSNTNALNVATVNFYGPGAGASGGFLTDMVKPSTEVPYVIVRDNVCLVYGQEAQFTVAANISVRLECAQITLDQATLNQLLRTQTV